MVVVVAVVESRCENQKTREVLTVVKRVFLAYPDTSFSTGKLMISRQYISQIS